MSVAILERETATPHYEVVVDTPEDLLFLSRAMSTVIAKERLSDHTDEHKLELAEMLRERVGDDVIEVMKGEHPEHLHYPIEESAFVLEALDVTRKQDEAERAAQKTAVDPEYDWLYDAKKTHPIVAYKSRVGSKLFRD